MVLVLLCFRYILGAVGLRVVSFGACPALNLDFKAWWHLSMQLVYSDCGDAANSLRRVFSYFLIPLYFCGVRVPPDRLEFCFIFPLRSSLGLYLTLFLSVIQ